MSTEQLFFEDLGRAFDSWRSTAVEALTKEAADLYWTDNAGAFQRVRGALLKEGVAEEDIKQVVGEILDGILNSALTVLDGGSYMSEFVSISLVDENGTNIAGDLHDGFARFLLTTGRASKKE